MWKNTPIRPTIQVIHPDLVEKILAEAKHILAEIGIEVRSKTMRARLLEHGLQTAPDGRVLFPPDVVENAIASTPRSFTLYTRDGRPHAVLGGDHVHFVPGSSGLSILDHRTDETRLANTADFVDYVRLCDGLEHIAYLATAFSTNDDIEAGISDAWRLYLTLTNSLKPVVSGAFTEHGVPRVAEMMQLFRASQTDLINRPMSIFTITATGNFRYSEDSCQNLLDCVERGIPVEIVPATIMGLIAPVTLVGATVFHVVDVLAGLTMAQIIKPGAPVLFGGAPAAFHMKAATSPMIAIEALHLDYLLVFSLPKLIFDHEVCGQVHHLMREMKPLDDFPTIQFVRHLLEDGHLLTSSHTIKYWQQELHLPGMVIDRLNRAEPGPSPNVPQTRSLPASPHTTLSKPTPKFLLNFNTLFARA